MKRGGYIERKSAMRRTRMKRKAPRRLSKSGSDPAYLERVRGLPCCARHLGLCDWGAIHAHHAFGVAQKADDSTATPLCWRHHAAWHDHNGDFRGWSREKRREFAVLCVGLTRSLLASPPGEPGTLLGEPR